MSTIDEIVRSALSPGEIPEALRLPVEGVGFVTYLIVEAARLDGLDPPAVLRWLGVRQAAFARAEERWSERIDEELARDDSTFDAIYDDLLARALSLWTRAVEPLDNEIEAWITYQRHALMAEDPGELARRAGLTPGDDLRLAHRWRERLGNPEMAARAAAAMVSPLAPLPKITLSPLVFPPARGPL